VRWAKLLLWYLYKYRHISVPGLWRAAATLAFPLVHNRGHSTSEERLTAQRYFAGCYSNIQPKNLIGYNGSVLLGHSFCCENDLLSILKRKKKGVAKEDLHIPGR